MKSCWLVSRAGLLVVLALAVGCGGGGEGKVSGQVLYNGKPLPGGWVMFRPADSSKNTVSARINQNGHYEATLPVGEVTIAVDNRELQPPSAGGGAPALPPGVKLPPIKKEGAAPPGQTPAPEKLPGTYVPIPEKYYDPASSGLTFSVPKGEHPHNIELK